MRTQTLLVFLAVAALFFLGLLFGGRLPKPFRTRECQGKSWRKSFPAASKQQIRKFLSLFVSAFAYNNTERLKLSPNDSLLSIYKAEYRRPWQPDALEFETFAQDLEKHYGVKLESVWQDGLTLGELFSHVLAARQSVA